MHAEPGFGDLGLKCMKYMGLSPRSPGVSGTSQCQRLSLRDRVIALRADLAGVVLGSQSAHGDQAEPEIADLGQQPVQRGLIGERAGDEGLGVLARDLETVEPDRPVVVQGALDPDLVMRVTGSRHWDPSRREWTNYPERYGCRPGRASPESAVRVEYSRWQPDALVAPDGRDAARRGAANRTEAVARARQLGVLRDLRG